MNDSGVNSVGDNRELSLLQSAKEGAQTILHLCLDPSGDEVNGQFWEDCSRKSTWKGNDAKSNKTILEVARRVLQDKKRQ